MGEYLDFANNCIKWLKPEVEKRTGIRLENIVVKDISEHPKYGLEEFPDNALMRTDWQMQDTVFMFESRYKNMPVEHVLLGLAHELSHLLYFKLNDEEDSRFEPIKAEYLRPKVQSLSEKECERECEKEYHKYRKEFDSHIERKRLIQEGFSNLKINEGLAEYMSLDFFRDLYDPKTCKFALKRSARFINHNNGGIPNNEIGYNFFRKVLNVTGHDKFFEVAKSPPMSGIEMKIPLLYLLRYYLTKVSKIYLNFFPKA